MFPQSGFSILTVLLLVITLMSGLAFFIIGSGPNVQSQMNAQKTTQLVAQAQLIVHRIVKCATDYPNGDNGTGLHKAYPAGSSISVISLICPGNSQNLWSGIDGVYLPASPEGFDNWLYTNTSPTIITITTSNQSGTYANVIATAAAKIGAHASSSINTLTIKIIE